MRRFDILGSYHKKNIELFVASPKEKISTVTIFVHGLYGVFNELDNKDKVNITIDELLKKNISHVLAYNSSRDFSYDENLNFELRQKAFEFKTFQQELEDLKLAVSWAIDNCAIFFGIPKIQLALNIHGTSLGGTLAILQSDFFPKIKKISLCGSGCGTNGSQKPILSSIFSEQAILDSVAEFSGKLLLFQGGNDTVVPKESGLKILEHAKKADVKYIVIDGANHNFSKMNGIESDAPKQEFASIVVDFLG